MKVVERQMQIYKGQLGRWRQIAGSWKLADEKANIKDMVDEGRQIGSIGHWKADRYEDKKQIYKPRPKQRYSCRNN